MTAARLQDKRSNHKSRLYFQTQSKTKIMKTLHLQYITKDKILKNTFNKKVQDIQ